MGLLVLGSSVSRPAAAQLSTVQGSVHDDEAAGVYGATVSLFRGDSRLYAADTDRLGSFLFVDYIRNRRRMVR